MDTGGHLARDVLEREDDPNVPSWHLDDGIEESVEADPEHSNANRRKLHEATQAQQVLRLDRSLALLRPLLVEVARSAKQGLVDSRDLVCPAPAQPASNEEGHDHEDRGKNH